MGVGEGVGEGVRTCECVCKCTWVGGRVRVGVGAVEHDACAMRGSVRRLEHVRTRTYE